MRNQLCKRRNVTYAGLSPLSLLTSFSKWKLPITIANLDYILNRLIKTTNGPRKLNPFRGVLAFPKRSLSTHKILVE